MWIAPAGSGIGFRAKCLRDNAAQAFLMLLCLLAIFNSGTGQAASLACPEEYRLSVAFDNGAGWELCWESTRRENIVLSDIHFSSPDKQLTRVISTLRLAQLHVTYDDSNITYNDVTQFGLGGGYIAELTASECPAGELININGKPGMCRRITHGDDAYRSAQESRLTEALTLFSISQVGAYSYLVTWKFFDDGSIEPSVGAAGALQRSADNEDSPHGRALQGVAGKSWLSHTHNYYWRVDFDLGDSATDDVVSEASYSTDAEGRRARSVERFTEESASAVSPELMRSWYITDGDDEVMSARGYVIEPLRYGHKLVRSDIEPFTEYDFFVTRQNDCERFVSENSKFNPGCGDDILQFVNAESVVGEDIVVWHRVSFHHVPRNEDRHHMHSHWDGFLMQARNLSSATPGYSGVADNSPPVLMAPQQLQHVVNESLSVQLASDDPDGDALVYSAVNLPQGVILTSNGMLQGAPVNVGNYRAVVTVQDKEHTSNALIQWQVSGRKSSVGSVSWVFILLTLAARLVSRRTRK